MDQGVEQEIIDSLKKILQSDNYVQKDLSDDEIKEVIKKKLSACINEKSLRISVGQKKNILDKVFNSVKRLDILQPLIENKEISEIMINGCDDVFIEKNGKVIRLDVKFENKQILENIVQKIVSTVNREVNEKTPIVDARLKDGSRVNVVLPPIALNGPIVTIRKFPDTPFTIEKMIEIGSITQEVADFLHKLVISKYNIFISGGTGSGKTTFLNALSNYIPKDERIITIEDSAELQIKNVENIVRLETRNKNTEGTGEITIRDLIKSSLRMRPDRIVVGEVRGAEALDMLQAMNTGHDGSLSTGHANSAIDMLSRLETMVLTGVDFPISAIRKQIASAIDIIVQIGRLRDKSRKVLEINEVLGIENGEIVLNPLYQLVEEEGSTDKKVIASLKRTENKFHSIDKLKMKGIYNGE
ncbi:MAG: CpaF family protein [Clostridium sp.]|uniref:CpaF family protein n=1 Tax=Clostridium sp. TaxID=1506 RepID=UPI002A91D08A|nr:CpaF family protein [Clostridium sp.]MDY6229115.1 CpaF family protein [Clostridium sp.]